jgi:hypothetical protein
MLQRGWRQLEDGGAPFLYTDMTYNQPDVNKSIF